MNGASLRRIALPFLAVLILLGAVLTVWMRSRPSHEDIARLIREGDSSRAEALARELIRDAERDRGREAPEVARALDLLVMALWQQGKEMGSEILEAAERAMRIKRHDAGVEQNDLAISLNNLASLLVRRGRYERAKALFDEVLSIRESTYEDPHHIKLATPLANLGRVLYEMGECDEARLRFERALKIREEQYGSGHLRTAVLRNGLGIVLHELGDFEAAEAQLTAALEVRRKLLPARHTLLAESCLNFARLLKDRGDTRQAEDLLKESLAIWEALHGDENDGTAVSLHYLGELYCDLGRYSEAKPLLERALRIRENVLGRDNAFFAWTLGLYAQLLAREGESSLARGHFDRALRIFTEALGSDYFLVGQLRGARGEFLFEEGRVREALADALCAERIGRNHVRAVGDSLAEREILRYDEVRASGLGLALSVITTEAPGTTVPAASLREVWDAVTRSRALVLDEVIGRHRRLARAAQPEIAALVRELEERRRRLAHLMLRGLSAGGAENGREVLSRLNEARAAKEETERRLAARSQEFRSTLERDRAGLDEVVKALPEDSALVAFVRYASHGQPSGDRRAGDRKAGALDAGRATTRGPAAAFAAFVLGHSRAEPEIVSLGRAKDIESLVARWRGEVAKGAGTDVAAARAAEAATKTIGTDLRRKVWTPVASRIGAAKRVFIVPDGVLHLVSFAALPAGDGYLVDRAPVIHYLSAERDLLRPTAPSRAGRGLLVVGAPAFDASNEGAPQAGSAKRETRLFHFEPLPGTAREAAEIASLWKSGTGEREVTLLTGDDAREEELKRRGPGREVLHLATHGFFFGAGRSELLGEKNSGARARGIAKWTLRRKEVVLDSATGGPLTLAGLALAGANAFGDTDNRNEDGAEGRIEDGILTAEEIASMDLLGVRWAVLSACDTGVGTVLAGEGVLGLRRAFQIAGVSTLIMSLWPVDDEATRRWMGALYRKRCVEKLETAEAVKGASLEFLREQRERGASTHPFFWAGFVAVGDWR